MQSTAHVRPGAPARSIAVLAVLLLALLAIPAVSAAVAGPPLGAPRASTGGASHVTATSALLNASIDPEGHETTYFFEYGTTTAYGSVTPTVSAGSGVVKIRVGQAIVRLTSGVVYHFRVVASNSVLANVKGRDHTLIAKGAALAFVLKRTAKTTYGTPFILSGNLTGTGSAGHRISLEASPFPFLEPFITVGAQGTTNGVGAFSFRVANVLAATQLRVQTVDPLPIFSPVILLTVVPRIVLHVRSSPQRGVVRLYGTITPAVNGAKVEIQVEKAIRPGRNEVAVAWPTQFTTVAKKGITGSSRFSIVATIRRGGRYRAYLKLPGRGKLAAGPSLESVILHAAPASALRKHK